MRVRVDSELCQGHQMCAIVAPDLFGSDDEGFGRLLGGGVLVGPEAVTWDGGLVHGPRVCEVWFPAAKGQR